MTIMNESAPENLRDQISKKLQQLDLVGREDLTPPFDQPFFLTCKKLKLADHFEIRPDLWIHDPKLETYGLLWILPEATKGRSPTEALRTHLSQAVYVRHLLALKDANQASPPPPVHVVAVLSRSELGKGEIANTLIHLMSNSEFFHAIDLHLLPWEKVDDDGNMFRSHDLDKAFCWLLRFTKSWFQLQGQSNPNADTPLMLEIENYRAMGKRTLMLNPSHKLHLLHGPNGSGKTSLAECLELCLTGRLKRLQGREGGYLKHLKHKETDNPTITLTRGNGPIVYPITESGIIDPLWKKSVAASFLLNQESMNRLSVLGATQRAIIFLEAFFPDERDQLKDYQERKKEVTDALEWLPTILKSELDQSVTPDSPVHILFLKKHAWLNNENIQDLSPCLPLEMETLQHLAKLNDELKKVLDRLPKEEERNRETIHKYCIDLAASLVKSQGQSTMFLSELNRAKELLERYNIPFIEYAQKNDARPYPQRLNDWLYYLILSRWGEQRLVMAQGVDRVLNQKWSPDLEDQLIIQDVFPLKPISIGNLSQAVPKWRNKGDQYRKSLMDQPEQSTSDKRREISTQATSSVTPPAGDSIEILNKVEKWFFPHREPSLGKIIQNVFLTGAPSSLEGIGILGEKKGWAEKLLVQIDLMIEACNTLNQLPINETNRFENLTSMFDASKALQKSENKLKKSFLKYLSEMHAGDNPAHTLQNALNELLFLFTPARWAYDPLRLQLDSVSEELQVETGDPEGKMVEAEYRLNTAELNQYAVALFLLLAPRMDNPLRLMVLDDPIQNMDEWSTVALARGIGNIRHILPDGWTLLIMFHGEDDMQRFTYEVQSAKYHLPWLRPKINGEHVAVEKVIEFPEPLEKVSSNNTLGLWKIIH